MTETPGERVDVKWLTRRLNRDSSTIARWVLKGQFPRHHYISGGRKSWWLHEVETWEREQMARPREPRAGARNLNPNAPAGASSAA